ncbi:hypothetical protein NL676_002798 [Syzygium grande]|nr:hypothetical protein NL676_002798 [Syzygium grande]
MFDFQDGDLDPEAVPPICREAVFEYEKNMAELKTSLAELLSEALGLASDYLSGTKCMKSETLVTNEKFKSTEHRVLAGPVRPCVSVPCFLSPSRTEKTTSLGPIKELLSENNLPIYKETSLSEYVNYYKSHGLSGNSTLPHFRISDSK